MEMLTQLQSEQHVAKELAARLGQQEDELKETREQVSGCISFDCSLCFTLIHQQVYHSGSCSLNCGMLTILAEGD